MNGRNEWEYGGTYYIVYYICIRKTSTCNRTLTYKVHLAAWQKREVTRYAAICTTVLPTYILVWYICIIDTLCVQSEYNSWLTDYSQAIQWLFDLLCLPFLSIVLGPPQCAPPFYVLGRREADTTNRNSTDLSKGWINENTLLLHFRAPSHLIAISFQIRKCATCVHNWLFTIHWMYVNAGPSCWISGLSYLIICIWPAGQSGPGRTSDYYQNKRAHRFWSAAHHHAGLILRQSDLLHHRISAYDGPLIAEIGCCCYTACFELHYGKWDTLRGFNRYDFGKGIPS